MKYVLRLPVLIVLLCTLWFVAGPAGAAEPEPAGAVRVILPMGRSAYFIGEAIPIGLTGEQGRPVTLVGRHEDEGVPLYDGPAGPLLIDTSHLAPGNYLLDLNGESTGIEIQLTPVLRKSAGSLQDEWLPQAVPRLTRKQREDPMVVRAKTKAHQEQILRTLRETEMSACLGMSAVEMARNPVLDVLAGTGTLALVNPDTRPTSFTPTSGSPVEMDGMTQRMLMIAQANGRYPNFGGFCIGWDVTGHAVGGRKGLMIYWGWGEQEDDLRSYIQRQDAWKIAEFKRRTGMVAVTQEEYIAYVLSLGRPEFAPMIDLPTRLWLLEMAPHIEPMPAEERAAFEKRLDASAAFLMSRYNETYAQFLKDLRAVMPAMAHTSSVQIDHAPVRKGQYFPTAYAPLDWQYQSTWNDQVGGPDYSYQWLFTAALLNWQGSRKPTWISNAFGGVHDRSTVPGKFVRVAAHNLAHGGSGIGFALEAFSNVLGGMNKSSNWDVIRDKPEGKGVLAGREFLHRFAALAVSGRGDHGVGVLFSRAQLGRQHINMGFGTAQYRALVALTRLGYTPRYVTQEEISAGGSRELDALVVVCQTVPLPEKVMAGLKHYVARGGTVLVDGSTSVELPGARKLATSFPFTLPGKPHNWGSPNMPKGVNDTVLYARWHEKMAPGFHGALGETGHAVLKSTRGAETQVTLMQIDGGPDLTWIVAVNDSHISTQADWHQVRERLVPIAGTPEGLQIYDCTEEKSLGALKPFECDLSRTTARVYGLSRRPVAAIDVATRQSARTDSQLPVRVQFVDDKGKRVRGVIPFHLSLVRPDGKALYALYRGTDREGRFAIELPLPANAPAGQWRVAVRCQLTGQLATLPIAVESGGMTMPGRLQQQVTVREREAIEAMLGEKAEIVLPLFEGQDGPEMQAVADRVVAVLKDEGVTVSVRRKPEITTYWLAYDPSEEQRAENRRAELGETIGRIKRTTINRNDWYCGMSGFRFGRPVILLSLARKKDNPMVQALERIGALWPEVSDAFPGNGRAVVQLVHWAFAPRTPALVIQAPDVAGLKAGAEALAKLPPDRLTPGVRRVRAGLFTQYHIGGAPASPEPEGLTSRRLTSQAKPQPFRIDFMGSPPVAADQVEPPEPVEHPAHNVPGVLTPDQFVTYYKWDGKYIECSSPGGKWPRDLRFSHALLVVVNVKQPGKMKLTGTGQFRYSDRRPRSQAQWEDLLALRDRLVPSKRKPMEMEVRLNGRRIGKLVPTETAVREVPTETLPWYAKQKPKSIREEVVTQLSGEVELAEGRQELLLIHRNIVDGLLEKLYMGVEVPAEEPAAKQ